VKDAAAREGYGRGMGDLDDDDPRLADPPHDPRWELEPRWSDADRARLERRRAEIAGPGLARRQPEDDAEESSRAG
jgi:hypothetical protein